MTFVYCIANVSSHMADMQLYIIYCWQLCTIVVFSSSFFFFLSRSQANHYINTAETNEIQKAYVTPIVSHIFLLPAIITKQKCRRIAISWKLYSICIVLLGILVEFMAIYMLSSGNYISKQTKWIYEMYRHFFFLSRRMAS